MVKLNAGNVLLKPSNRKQLMAWLRRALKLGERLGNFFLTITMHRTGKLTEVRADVHTGSGEFACRSRSHDWRDAVREIVRTLSLRLADQRLRRTVA